MKNSSKIVIGVLLSALIFWACSETPTNLGSDVLNDDFGKDILVQKTFDSDITPIVLTSEVYKGPDTLSSHSREHLLIGNLEKVSSKVLIKFDTQLVDTVISNIESGAYEIISSKVEIVPQVIIGKQNPSEFTFEMYQLSEKINEEADHNTVINHKGQDHIETVSATDTIITATISEELSRDWLTAEVGDSSLNYGVLLTAPAYQNLMRIDSRILSETVYGIRVTIDIIEGGDTSQVKFVPTVRRTISNIESENLDPDRVYVQGIKPLRTNFYFDKEQLPQNIAINEAYLELDIDHDKSFLRRTGSDTIQVSLYVNEAKDSLDFGTGTTYLVKSEDGEKFKGNISLFLSKLLENDYNYGFRLRSFNEFINGSKIVLKNENAPVGERPRILIDYSQKK